MLNIDIVSRASQWDPFGRSPDATGKVRSQIGPNRQQRAEEPKHVE